MPFCPQGRVRHGICQHRVTRKMLEPRHIEVGHEALVSRVTHDVPATMLGEIRIARIEDEQAVRHLHDHGDGDPQIAKQTSRVGLVGGHHERRMVHGRHVAVPDFQKAADRVVPVKDIVEVPRIRHLFHPDIPSSLDYASYPCLTLQIFICLVLHLCHSPILSHRRGSTGRGPRCPRLA